MDRQVDFPEVTKNFAGTKLNEHFCARWSGIVRCPKAGKFTFYTESDDGSQLFIEGSLVVDNGGADAMRERHGDVTLEAGDHVLRLEFVQGEGEAGCKLSWSFDGREKQLIPAEALFHRAAATSGRESATVEPGLLAEFYELGGAVETFPDLAASRFDAALLRIAADPSQPVDLRVQAASVVVSRQAIVNAPLFGTLMMCVGQGNTPLVRLEAAEALGRAAQRRAAQSRGRGARHGRRFGSAQAAAGLRAFKRRGRRHGTCGVASEISGLERHPQ